MRSTLPLLALALAVLAADARAQGNVYLASSFFRQKKYEKVLKVLEAIDEPGPRLLFYKAESLAGLDRRPEAVKAYEELIERFPTHPDAFDSRRKILLLLEQDKNHQAMVEKIRGFRDGDPEGRLPYNRLEADAQFKAGKSAEAIALLEGSDEEADQRTLAEILQELGQVESHLGSHPVADDDFAALRRRGLLLEQLRLPVQAATVFRKAVALRPEDRFCLERMADALEGSGANEEARDTYRTLMRLDPGEVKYGARLGKLLWADGHPDEARKQWRSLVEGSWDDSQRARLVVRLLLEHDDPTGALEVIHRSRTTSGRMDILLEEEETAHRKNRDLKGAAAVWVRVLLRVGEPARGEIDPREHLLEMADDGGPPAARAVRAAVEEAIESYPMFVEYYVLADELLHRAGELERIPALMGRLVQAVGRDAGTLRDHAVRFRESRRPLEASILFEAAHDLLPPGRRWVVALEAAEAFRAHGEPARAREFLAPFFREPGATPQGAPPQALLLRAADLEGRILLEDLQQNLEARRHFTRWIPRVDPGSEWVVPWVVLAARAAAATGDFPAAEAALKALLERGGTKEHTAEIHFRTGRLHLFAGKLEEARQILRRVGEAQPESPLANDALREVAWLLDHRDAGEDSLRRFLALRHLVEAGRFDDFRKAVADAGQEEADVPHILQDDHLWAQAVSLRAAGDDTLLRDTLKLATERHTESPRRSWFLAELAECEERRGAFAEAEAAWREFLVAEPDGLRLEEVRTRLARLARRRKAAASGP